MERAELIEALRYCKAKAEERKDASARCEAARKKLEEVNRQPTLRSAPRRRISAGGVWISFACMMFIGGVCLFLPEIREWMAGGKLRPAVAACGVLVIAAVVSQLVGFLVGSVQYTRKQWEVEEENEEIVRRWERRKVGEGYSLRQDVHKYEDLREKAQQALNERADRCGLHPHYRGEQSLKYLIVYLESGRADNLKEALNLYEGDIERFRQRKERREFREHIEKVLREELAQLQQELKRDLSEVSAGLADTAAAGMGDGEDEEEPVWGDEYGE